MVKGDANTVYGESLIIHQGNLYRFGERILRFRWYLIFGFGLFVLLFEGLELFEQPEAPPLSDPHIRLELTLYLLVIIIVALLAEYYVRLLRMHSQALKVLRLKHQLSQDFNKSENWTEICEQVCHRIGEFGPFDEVMLFTYEAETSTYRAQATWKAEQVEGSRPHHLPPILLEVCDEGQGRDSGCLQACACSEKTQAREEAGGYCMPIGENHSPVARIYVRLTPGKKLSQGMADLLENLTDEIASALTTTRLRQMQAEMRIAQSTAELRQIISHDLHDTIGQNLCYLRMKLDQYSQAEIQEEPDRLKPDLENLRDLANESYELMHGLFVAISPEPAARLEKLLEYHAKLVSDRTKLNIQVVNHGQPRGLNPTTIYHIYFIFREALNNIERHAKAQNVTVNILWSEGELQIKIVDNGKGFDPNFQPSLGHYGLAFMDERARSLGGRLDLLSSINEGTHVSLWLPLVA